MFLRPLNLLLIMEQKITMQITLQAYYNSQLSVSLSAYSLSPPRRYGLSNLNYQGVMGVTVGQFTVSLVKIRAEFCS